MGSPVAIVFLELFAILAASRLVGWCGRRFLGQPQVVGEMIAGVLLGPSLFGLVWPAGQALLFPPETRGVLQAGAQLGVGLYMFLVGLGFDRGHFRTGLKGAAAVSLSGMAAPFLAAALIVPWLTGLPGLFAPALTRFQATLFLGACISITAFPMLARIVHERGLAGSRLGALALAAGAIDDAVAWIVLALVLALFGEGPGVAVKAILGAGAFAVVMLRYAPGLLRPLGARYEAEGGLSEASLGIVLGLFLLAAFAMEFAGMHAVFGGFLLGTAMPRGRLVEALRARLEPFTVVLLLPIFFTFSGLNTRLDLLADAALLPAAAAVLLLSVLAKLGACWAAARLTGEDGPTAWGIAALMNARGLMELIIVNIGLQRGLIGPALFSMLVLMAVVTTLIATPLFERLSAPRPSGARGTARR